MDQRNKGKSLLNGGRVNRQIFANLTDFVENNIDAIFILNSQGKGVYINPAAERMLGWTASEVQGKPVTDVLNPDNITYDGLRQLQLPSKNGEVIRGETLVWGKENAVLWVEYTTQALLGEENELSGYMVVLRNINEQKQTEEDLKISEKLFKKAFHASPNALVVSRMEDGRIERINETFVSFFGYSDEEVIGKTSTELGFFVNPSDRQNAIRRLEMEKTLRNFEIEVRLKSGEIRSVNLSIEVISIGGEIMMLTTIQDIAHRKQAEEDLRARNEEIEMLLQVSPIAIFVAHDPECIRITANPAGYQLVKLPENENKNVSKSAPVDEQPGYQVFRDGVELDSQEMPMQVAARQGREVFEESLELRFEDGSHKYIYAYARPLTGEDGKPRGAVAAMLDITERKKIEERLRYQAALLANVNDAIIASDDQYRITAWNAGAETLYGWQAEEVIGRNGLDVIRTEWPEMNADEMRRTVAREGRWRGEATQVCKDGTRFPVEVSSLVVRNDEGRVTGYVSVNRDITERKQTEVALRESEERFRSLANTVPSIVWTAAPDGTTLYNNEFWYKYTGASLEEDANNWGQFLHPEDLERSVTTWKQAIESTSDYSVEMRIRRHDGEYRWFQTQAVPVRDRDGNITAWYGVTTDIHDRIEAVHAMRESQQQLQFLNETLEQKVDEQTAEMRRLTSELTKVEQRERHRIAHILHDDLQQRIYAVKMRLAFLLEGQKVEPTQGKEIVEMDEQLAEILSLIRHLTIEMSPPVLHDEGLTQAIEWLALQMDEKLGLRIEVEANEPFAMEDEAIQVLLFNCVRELLFNIVKHAGVERARVSLKRSGTDLIIDVRDEGKGFDPSILLRSNPWRVEDNPRQLGFGLPTLRHQLNLVGGQMNIHSEPNNGTWITISIPYS